MGYTVSMTKNLWVGFFFVLLFLAACGDVAPEAEPTEVVAVVEEETAVSPTSAPTHSPTSTLAPSATSTHTPSPTAMPTETATMTPPPLPTLSIRVEAGTAVPQSNQPITTDNVTQLTELARWGRGVINDIALSGNGRWLAVGTATGVYIHDTEDLSKTVHHLETPRNVRWVAISPEGSFISASLVGDLVQVWDVERKQVLYEKELSGYGANFSPDGDYIILGDLEGTHIVRTSDGEIAQIYPETTSAQFSLDSSELAVWSYNPLSIYDWPQNSLITEIKPLTFQMEDEREFGSAISSAQFLSDGEILMSALPVDPAYGPTGDILVQKGKAGDLHLELGAIRAVSEEISGVCNQPVIHVEAPPNPPAWQMELSLNGEYLAFLFRNIRSYGDINAHTDVRFYDQDTGQLIYSVEEGIEDFAIMPNNEMWVTGTQDGRLQARSLHDGSVLDSVDDYDVPALKTAVSPDNEWIAVEYLNEVKVFQVENGDVVYQYPAQRIAFSPDGETFALGYEDGRLDIHSLVDNQLLKTIFGHSEGVTAVTYLSSGELLSTGLDCGFYMWEPKTGREINSFENYFIKGFFEEELVPVRIMELTASQDSQFVVGQFGRDFGVWDIESGELLNILDTENYPDSSALFENTLAIAGSPIWVGQLEKNGQVTESWTGDHAITDVTFSPDGEFIVSGIGGYFGNVTYDGTLKFILTDNGEFFHEIMPVTDDVTGIAFAPNGRYFVSTTIDGVTRLWGVP